MNDDDDKTVIQTEEDREELKKRLLGELFDDACTDDPANTDQARKAGD